jgi:hypothetical protein
MHCEIQNIKKQFLYYLHDHCLFFSFFLSTLRGWRPGFVKTMPGTANCFACPKQLDQKDTSSLLDPLFARNPVDSPGGSRHELAFRNYFIK